MSNRRTFSEEFLTSGNAEVYRDVIAPAIQALQQSLPSNPFSGRSPHEITQMLDGEILPSNGSSIDKVLEKARTIIGNSVSVTHPHTIAHLHPPPLIASLAADLIISALNQSMDSFDESPSATMLELALVRWLCKEAGFPAGSDAIFTSGATQSNFMALLLARDACIASRWNWRVQQQGLPQETSRLRFLCSEMAHFTVEKSAHQLGLGTGAVIRVPVDDNFCMRSDALAESLDRLHRQELIPAAIVATAGTTDFGSIDPLPEIAVLARKASAWFHVDAAYGSALLLSSKSRGKLKGLEQADSISMDFHKLFWQSISCAALAVRDANQFRHLELHADYLNPEGDEASGIPNLVTKSLSTTRRFDALKLWFSFQLLGRKKFAEMIERTIELASYAAVLIERDPVLALLHQPQFGCVVFRYRSELPQDEADLLNARLRENLLQRGVAVVGHTRVHGRQCLKLTCMNPMTNEDDIDKLVQLIVEEGKRLEIESRSFSRPPK